MGNNGASKIVGIFDVVTETNIECTLRLKDVKHVRNFIFNMISSRIVDDIRFLSTLMNGSWKIINVLFCCKGQEVLFPLEYLREAMQRQGTYN